MEWEYFERCAALRGCGPGCLGFAAGDYLINYLVTNTGLSVTGNAGF